MTKLGTRNQRSNAQNHNLFKTSESLKQYNFVVK